MWPKVLLQLVDLLPHASRLIPMADRFFQSRAAGDEATLKAVESLRSDLAQTTSAHEGLYRQMNEQAERMSALVAETRATKAALETNEARRQRLEKKVAAQSALLIGLVIATALVVLLLVVVIVMLRH